MARTLPLLRDWNRVFLDLGGGRPAPLPILLGLCAGCSTRRRRCVARAAATTSRRGRCPAGQWCTGTPPSPAVVGRPGLPYVVAVVAIEEDARVRLTTNIVGCDPADVEVGLPVRVVFDPTSLDQGEMSGCRSSSPPASPWSLVGAFAGDDGEARADPLGPAHGPRREVRGPGGRQRHRPVEDRAQADGRHPVPDGRGHPPAPSPTPASPWTTSMACPPIPAPRPRAATPKAVSRRVESALGFRPTWHNGGQEVPGATGSLIAAMLAVAAGLCRHVVCFRTVWQSSFGELARRGEVAATGPRRVVGRRRAHRPLRCAGRACGGHGGLAAHGPVRHNPRDPRLDRPQRSRQRRARPHRALPRPALHGRLPRGPNHQQPLRACSTVTPFATAPSRW